MATLNQNILLAGVNLLDTATITNPSAFNVNFPAANLQDPRMWLFSRFTSVVAANTYVVFDLGSPQIMQLFAVLKHNMSESGTWRIRTATSVPNLTAAPNYDSGSLLLVAYPEGSGEGINNHAFHPTTEAIIARYVRIDFSDQAGAEARVDNWLQFARMWAGPIYQPSLNMVYGAEAFIDDATDVTESENMVLHFSPLIVRQRRLVAQFNDLPTAELLNSIFGNFIIKRGRTKDMIAILQPLSDYTYPYEAVYGRLAEIDGAKHTYPGRMSTGLHVRESV